MNSYNITYNTYVRVGATFSQPTHPNIAPTLVPTVVPRTLSAALGRTQATALVGTKVGKPWATRSSVPHGTHLLVLLLLLTLACGGAWAQESEYQTTYGGTEITNISIQHKQPKWVSLHEGKGYADDFNENGWVFTEKGESIQAANLYVDTIYMHKGTSITLEVPYRKNGNVSVANYVRWFDFRSDGNYYCNISGRADLLTMTEFSTNGSGYGASEEAYVYRFQNGYVGGWGLTNSNAAYGASFYYPTDSEFSTIYGNNSSFNNGDNDYYIVACDASMYNDFASTYSAGEGGSTFGEDYGWCEPTLSGRALFYVIGIEDEEPPKGFEHYWCLTSTEYQGGGNAEGTKYLEEYEITFPARRTSINTDELVTLSKDPQAYAIPKLSSSGSDTGILDVAFATGEANGLTLVNATREGTNRVIQFYKDTSKAQWKVEDKSTATILVTKTVNETIYNIARYKLTFREDVTPLTQTQVAGLSELTGVETYWWKDLTHRSPEFMETNYEKITSLTFSYDTDNNASNVLDGGMSYAYPFPLEWDYCGYAFYDGSPSTDINSSHYGTSVTSYTQWGMYSIVNEYIGYGDMMYLSSTVPPKGTAKDDGGYWLYLDASDRPGSLAELTFDERLCQGSELFGTAWIKSASRWSSGTTDDDGAVLFTIMGVSIDKDGNEIHEPIYRQCSGQIMITNYLTDPMDETEWNSEVTGKGEGTNQWFQLYFSFINSGNVDYDHYSLRIDNYCASTGGGDYYFDEVKIYVLHPSVEVVQLDPICATSDDDKSSMRLDIDYEIMMSRLGYEPSDYTNDTDKETAQTASVDFVIINETQYRNALAAYEDVTDSTDPSYDADAYKKYQEEAFKAALVTFYDASGEGHQFPTLDFYRNYSLNQEYNEEKPGKNIVTFDSNDEGYFYSRTVSPTEYLSVDCLTDMMAYTEYLILLEPHTETDKSSEQKLEEFIELLDDQCAIKTEFYLSSETILKLNGETLDPTTDYCAGQEFVISPEVTYTDPETGETIYIDGVYFDWFFGSRDEYVAANPQFGGDETTGEGGVSLEEALIMFRTYYPDAEELSETETPWMEGEASQVFTKDHYDIIEYYLGQERYGGMNNMLVLHRSHLDMRVLNTGLELVIQPIEMHFDEENVEICFGYVPLSLSASGDAPTLKMGFSNINYPDDDYEPCLRLGLAQFEQCSETTPFTINLCKATYVTEVDENGKTIEIDHLGVADGMDMLFLVDTDDPAYRDIILGKGDEEEILIGKVARLYATTDNGNDPRQDTPTSAQDIGSYMQIYFYGEEELENDPSITPLTVREGYYYVVSVYFQEKGAFDAENNDEPVGSACWGTFPLEMKIVPEYLVWTGDSTCNWNNDDHWQRVSATSINRTTDASSPYFTDGSNTNTNGFVPMLFTKVIIPRDSEAELYMAGFIEGTDNMLSWQGDDSTANHDDVSESPTSNIMYDMMLYETTSTDETTQATTSTFKTEHYRVNLCDQIHFEPGAQLLHSEQLIYNKAWTDVELAQDPWTLVSTPLRDVVSGDWYTKKATGTETAEYFTDIEFSSTYNDRLDPMVYQRNWSNKGNTIVYTDATTGTSKSVPAYVSTGWSSVYNDVSVSHQAGEGFSIKASRALPVSSTDSLMFRFPKADGSYTYQDGSTTATTITRTNAGRLLISDLVSRTDPDEDDDNVYTGTVNVSLTRTENGYYIIGNPYTAPMSMSAFIAENEDIKGYWTEATYGPIAGTTSGNSWGTADCLIEPYSAFFVTTDENDITPLLRGGEEVTFTKDMQTFELDEEPTGPGPHVRKQTSFAVRAKGEGGTTSASIAYADKATDDYSAGEDAVLMEDASWKREGMPLVYSVAGDKAVSVNTLKQLTLIPIGAFADEGSLYTLSFVGVDMLDTPVLIDTYEDTETPLTEGYTLEVDGPTHGRYFIRTMSTVATDIEETPAEVDAVSAYSPVAHTVVVSSVAGIESVELYSIDGKLLNRTSVGGSVSCTINGVTSGIAIVKVKGTTGTEAKKIRVR